MRDRRRPILSGGGTRLAAPCVALALALATATPALAARVRTVALRGPPCLDKPRTVSELLRQLGSADVDCEELRLWIHPTGPAEVALVMTCGERTFRRNLPLAADTCSELPETIALVADGLLRVPWRRFAEAQPPPADPPASAVPAPADVRLPVAPAEGLSSENPPARQGSRFWLTAQAGASLPLVAGRRGLEIGGAADWDLAGPWGLSLSVSHLALSTARVPPGTAALTSSSVAALARLTLWPRSDGALDLLAGPGLVLASMETAGYWRNEDLLLFDGCLEILVRARQSLGSGLGAVLGAGVSLRTRQHGFQVAGLGRVLFEPAARATLGAGLSWSRF